jgi:hypothetical protein
MREPAKRNVRLLSLCALTILVGLWIELLILVVPSLLCGISLATVSAAVGSGLFFATRLMSALGNAAGRDAAMH